MDADKSAYTRYVQHLLDYDMIPIGGLIAADNVLFRGEVAALWNEESGGRTRKTFEKMMLTNSAEND